VGLFPGRKRTGRWWVDHSLSLVLAAILLAQTAWMVWTGHAEWLAEQADHGQLAAGWPLEFWRWWSYEYAASTVADTYGVLLVVLLTKWLFERGSAESKDET
jgi:hypothetical protein